MMLKKICDIIKYKNKVDAEIFRKALKNYIKSKNKNLSKLAKYAKIMNIPISFGLLKLGFPVYIVLVVYVVLNVCCAATRIWWLQHLIHFDVRRYCKEVLEKIVLVTLLAIPIPITLHFLIQEDTFGSVIFETLTFIAIYIVCIFSLALTPKEKGVIYEFKRKLCSKYGC